MNDRCTRGVGIDAVEVRRIERSLARSADFAALVFTDGERAACDSRRHPGSHYASRFAAKEAFLKAVGRGVLDGIALRDIELLDGPGGPSLRLHASASAALAGAGARTAHVSLSHSGPVAFSVVVID